MRKLAAFALLISMPAWACPDLTGNYLCTYQDGSTEQVALTQTVVNGVTVYNYNGSEIPADNVVRPMPDDESIKQATFRAWCDGASLKGNLIGKYWNNGAEFGDVDLKMDFSLENTNLKYVTDGTLVDKSGTTHSLAGSVTCTKN